MKLQITIETVFSFQHRFHINNEPIIYAIGAIQRCRHFCERSAFCRQ